MPANFAASIPPETAPGPMMCFQLKRDALAKGNVKARMEEQRAEQNALLLRLHPASSS
jgi:hypothetical protein